MKNNLFSESEMSFARIIWEMEPVWSGELVKICQERFGWKKSTTYTVLKNLCREGIFQNENAVVLFLLMIRPLMKRLPRIGMYIFWFLVLVRILCPATVNGIYGLLPEKVEQSKGRIGTS